MMEEREEIIDQQLQIIHIQLLQAENMINSFNTLGAELMLNNVEPLIKTCEEHSFISCYYELRERVCERNGDIQGFEQASILSLRFATNDAAKSRGYTLLARSLIRQKRFNEALQACDNAILHGQKVPENTKFCAEPMRIKGDIYYKQGMYDKAIHYLNEAAYYAEQNKLYADLGSALAQQGDCFRKIHKPELALSIYLKAETYFRDCHNYYYYSSVLLRRVDLMFELGLDDKARKIISQYVNEKP